MLISSAQCRAARAALNMTQEELAGLAGLSRTMVVDFERGLRAPLTVSLNALQDALENAGAQFPRRQGKLAGVFFSDSDAR